MNIFQELSYLECINIIALIKIGLNISPLLKTTYERIKNSLFNYTIVCSNETEAMMNNIKNINNVYFFYNLNNITDLVNILKNYE